MLALCLFVRLCTGFTVTRAHVSSCCPPQDLRVGGCCGFQPRLMVIVSSTRGGSSLSRGLVQNQFGDAAPALRLGGLQIRDTKEQRAHAVLVSAA